MEKKPGNIILCGLLAILVQLVFLQTAQADADKIYADNKKAVVVIVALDEQMRPVGQGSGFIVREDGAIVTNYHVINAASKIKVKVGERIYDVEGLIYADIENDLAVLKIDGKNLPKVKLGSIERLQVGEKVYVIGSPQGFENTISEGILSGIRKIDEKRKILQITAAISPGSSGAPVFNKNGEAIGVATFLIAEAQNMNFAMPIDLVKDKIMGTKLVTPGEACAADFTGTADCWFYQGVAYGSNGMFEKSIGAFEKAIQMKPDFAEAYFNLGVSYMALSRLKEARESLEKAIQIKPDSPDAYVNLGAIFSRLRQDDDAIRVLKKAIELDGKDAGAHFNLGVSYVHKKAYKEAQASFEEAIRLKPDFAAAHGYLGVTYAKLKDYKKSSEALKQAIRLQPDDPKSHFALGETYLGMDDRASALEEYKMLKKLDPALADKLFNQIYK